MSETAATKTFGQMAAEVDQYCQDMGWRENEVSFGEAMALLHSEIAEASDAWRKHGLEDVTAGEITVSGQVLTPANPKPEGVPSEFADIFIRLLDDSVIFGADLDAMMRRHFATYYVSNSFLENMNGLHSMVAQATEFHHEGGGSFRYQLARILGFLQQLCDRYGIDLLAEYERKMAYNRSRPYRHGGKRL